MGRDDGEAWKAQAYPGTLGGRACPRCGPSGSARGGRPDRRQEVLGQFARAWDAAELIQPYRPLVEDLEADYVALQVASLDPMARYGSWPPRSSHLS
jgi:coenzyme F420-dependent glucose-6-phosphate dehydrogenase